MGPEPEPAPEAEEEPDADPEREADRPRRGGRWRRPLDGNHANDDDASEGGSSENEPAAPLEAGWDLGGSHFVLSFERLTSALSWRNATKVDGTNAAASSGVDVSFLTAGAGRTTSSVPRIMFDGIVDGGFTFGGGLGVMSSSGKNEGIGAVGESDLPTQTAFILAGRFGYFTPTSDALAIWLRGGITRTSITSQVQGTIGTGQAVTFDRTVTAVQLSIDPQLVFVPAPHVGITLGPLLDIPIGGTSRAEGGGESAELDFSSSAYGITAGASAIF